MSLVTEIKEVTEKQEVLVDITCNRCGKSCEREGMYEKLSVYASWGYSSRKDTSQWRAELCEECADVFKAWVEEAGGKIDVTSDWDLLA